MTDDQQAEHDAITEEMQRDLTGAIEQMADAVAALGERGPGSLLKLSWTALALAQRCQELSDGLEFAPEEAQEMEQRFVSTEGALFRANGMFVSWDCQRFPNVAHTAICMCDGQEVDA